MPFHAFWEDQERHRMDDSIESRFRRRNDQRLLDQKATNIALKNTMAYLVFIRLQSIFDQTVLKLNSNVERRHLRKVVSNRIPTNE